VTDSEPETLAFAGDGAFPNSRLPVLVYHRLDLANDPASAERAFAANNWRGAWRDGIFPFHHFHSTAHEVLAIVGDRVATGVAEGGNVRFLEPTPLPLLLPHCDLLIHQGGGGTLMTALAYGVPQLLLPLAADHTSNAEQLAASGAGRWIYAGWVTAAAITSHVGELLNDPRYRRSARRLQAEMAAQPSSAQVAASLEQVVAEWER